MAEQIDKVIYRVDAKHVSSKQNFPSILNSSRVVHISNVLLSGRKTYSVDWILIDLEFSHTL